MMDALGLQVPIDDAGSQLEEQRIDEAQLEPVG